MSLFNVDLRREAVKNAQSVGTALSERVNKAAWKTYLPALIDLLVSVLRDPSIEYKDRLASILGENKVMVNDLIAIMAAAKSQIAQYGRDSESMGGFLVALCADVEMDDDALFIAECGQQAASLATRVPSSWFMASRYFSTTERNSAWTSSWSRYRFSTNFPPLDLIQLPVTTNSTGARQSPAYWSRVPGSPTVPLERRSMWFIFVADTDVARTRRRILCY